MEIVRMPFTMVLVVCQRIRKRYGLVLQQDIKFNAGMSCFGVTGCNGLIDDNQLIYKVNQ